MKKHIKALICLLLVFALSNVQASYAATLELPSGLFEIEEEAFAGDTSLDEVVVPNGFKRIEARAFADSSIKSITIPSTISYIADNAFDNSSLKQVNADWNTSGAKWALENGFELVTSSDSSFVSVDTIESAGNTKAENGTDVTDYLGKCFTVQDKVGGWFKFTAPVGGSYTFSVKAPDISESFYIRVYANRNDTISQIAKFRFDKSDEIITYKLDDVVEGETIYWWDAKSSNTGYTFRDPFQLMVAPIENITKAQTALITGTVKDAITGEGIEGVTVTVVTDESYMETTRLLSARSMLLGANPLTPVVYSAVTDRYGVYSLLAPIGRQFLHFELPGYISYDQEVTVSEGGGTISPAILSKKLEGDQYRVVLRWSSTPKDLDSHLVNTNFHVYYSQKTTTASDAMLDLDDTDGEGPETVTFTAESGQIYSYYVHDYTNKDTTSSSALAASGATVLIYYGDSVVERHVPQGVGKYWHVFDLVNGSIKYVDTIGDGEPQASTVTTKISNCTTGEDYADRGSYELKSSQSENGRYLFGISTNRDIYGYQLVIYGMENEPNLSEPWNRENGVQIYDDAMTIDQYNSLFEDAGGLWIGKKDISGSYIKFGVGTYITKTSYESRTPDYWNANAIHVIYDIPSSLMVSVGKNIEYMSQTINDTVSENQEVISDLKNGHAIIFFFEGCGSDESISARANAAWVVVKHNESGEPYIVDQGDKASTIPDSVFEQYLNYDAGNPSSYGSVPTTKDGIYYYCQVLHTGYAALQVGKSNAWPNVARFETTVSGVHQFDEDGRTTSAGGIHIHKRYGKLGSVDRSLIDFSKSESEIVEQFQKYIKNGTFTRNSTGCITIDTSEYTKFLVAVGRTDKNDNARNCSGRVVVDRQMATDYLLGIYETQENVNRILGTGN